MISNQSRTKEWIMQTREIAAGKDPILIEKVIMALTLVENLRSSGLDFIFKGGTSLTLLLGKPSRFSIDIVLSKSQNLLPFFNRSLIRELSTIMRRIAAQVSCPSNTIGSFLTR
jgi:hypothetical protein